MKQPLDNLARFARWHMVACALLMLCGLAGLRAAQTTSTKFGDDLFTNGVIRRIQIELKPESIASLRTNTREFVSGNVSDGGSVYSQVAIRLKGATGSFRPLDDKPSLTLDFSRFEAGRKFHGLRRIHLNNSVEDPGYTNEKLGSELFQAAGIPAPRVTRALVELNGRVLGLYVLKEGFTEDFLAQHFQKVGGELYEPETGHDVNEELDRNSVAAPFDKDRSALKRLAAAIEEPDLAARWKKLESSLDTKRFVDFMAMEILLGHRDGYCIARNNFRVYHDLDSDRMTFFPSGMDQLFGTADFPWQPHWGGAAAQALMETAEGRRAYATAFGALLTNVFNVGRLTNRIEQLVQELRPVLGKSEFAAVKAETDAIKERIVNRRSNLLAQMKRPPRKPMELNDGVGHPTGWEIVAKPSDCDMNEVSVTGIRSLQISTRAPASASWRTNVLLPRGRYSFMGQASVSGVEPLPFGTRQGAALRVGGRPERSESFVGDSQWRTLRAEFEVAEAIAEVELICELRARAGEAWFDRDSLRVVRIGNL